MKLRTVLAPVLALLLLACGDTPPIMLGEHNVLVVAPDSLWAEVEDSVRTGLWVRLPGLPPESLFSVTHTSAQRTSERDLRRYRQVVVVGTARDSLVHQAIPPTDVPVSPPTLVQADDVWTTGQKVIVLVLPEGDGPDTVVDHVPELAAALDRQYRAWTLRRMYSMGIDSELSEVLMSAGVEIAIPALYRWLRPSDSTFVFATRTQDIDPRLRSVLLTWRPLDDREISPSGILDWRQTMADRHYAWDHTTRREPLEVEPLDTPGLAGLELRGAWGGTVEGQPHAGPFITRVVDCPAQGRRYLLDAWVFAPNRGKYRYLVQLQALLDTFDCPAP